MVSVNISKFRLSCTKMYYLFLILYCIGGIAAIYFSMTRGLNREHIGFAFLTGAILCVLLAYTIKPKFEPAGASNGAAFKISISIWFLVFACSILFMLGSLEGYYLSLEYFLSIALLSMIIGYQILAPGQLSRIKVFAIIAEIVILAMFHSSSILYLFPAPIGNDAIFHANYISSILSSGNLYSYPYVDQYANFPVYHLTFAGLMLLSDVNLQTAQSVVALVQVLAVLFVLLICVKIMNVKIALLSTLLITLSSQVIIPRYSLFPSSAAIVFYMLFLFVLVCFGIKKRSIWPVMVIVLLTINLMHVIAAIVLTFTLIFCYILSKMFKLELMDIRYVLLSAFIMLVQFVRPIPHTDSFGSKLALYVSDIIGRSSDVSEATMSNLYSWYEVVLYDLWFVLLMIFGICGALMFWRMRKTINIFNTGNIKSKTVFLSSITLAMTPVPYVVAMISPNMLPDRWFVYVSIFLGMFSAATIYLLARQSIILKPLMLMAIPLIVFLAITSPISNPNNHILLQDMSVTPSVTLSEMNAADFFKNNVNLDSLWANSLYAVQIDYSLTHKCHFINPGETYSDEVLAVRDYDMKNGFTIPKFGEDGKLLEIIKPTPSFTEYVDNAGRFYDSGSVKGILGPVPNAYSPENGLPPGGNQTI